MSNNRTRQYCDKLRSSQNTCEFCDSLFTSREDMNRSMSKVCSGNLGVLGKIWIYTLKVFLLGFQCPVVACTAHNIPKCEATHEENKLKRYTDLSFSDYDCPQEAKKDRNSRIIFNKILPYVTASRQSFEGLLKYGKKEVNNACDKIKNDVRKTGERIENYFRGEENLDRRRQLVAAGGMLGYLRPGGVPARLLSAVCGLTAVGILCFPEETKETFRGILFHIENISKKLCRSDR